MDPLLVLSLGWGIQSTTLASMSALGELPKLDYAIHSDTLHERQKTYAFAKRFTPWLEEHGIKVITVKDPSDSVLIGINNKNGGVFIPAFTINFQGKRGQLRRQCTSRWKIFPIRRFLQSVRNKRPVIMWLGISLDEFHRMKSSNRKYITNAWPLIDFQMSRQDCEAWLINHGLEVPVKSSCTFCPFHDVQEWIDIKSNPHDWREAIFLDNSIRKLRPPFDLFIHQNRKPLDQIKFNLSAHKQLSLWSEECTGLCGV